MCDSASVENCGAFHADVGSAAVNLDAHAVARHGELRRKTRAGRLVECDVGHDAAAEKGGFAPFCAVEELIGDEEIHRRIIFAKRAHRADGNDVLDAENFQRIDVGAVIDFARREEMAASVARKKSDAAAFERAHDECIRGIAEGSLDADFTRVGKTRHLIEAAAADDADFDGIGFGCSLGLYGFCHGGVQCSPNALDEDTRQIKNITRPRQARSPIGRRGRADTRRGRAGRARKARANLPGQLRESNAFYFRASSSGTDRIP